MSSWKGIKKIYIQISFHFISIDASAELRTVGVGPRNWPAPENPNIIQFLSILSQHAPLHFTEAAAIPTHHLHQNILFGQR
jgi:hypothetical protein